MTDASSDSDESAGRAQDWEVVSLSTLSMSGSGTGVCACDACTSALQDAGSGRSGEVDGAVPQANFVSNHFGTASSHHTSPMLDQFLGSVDNEAENKPGNEEEEEHHDAVDASAEKDGGENSNVDNSPTATPGSDEIMTKTGIDGKKEGDEGVSEGNYVPEMDWIEPTPPSTDNLLREGSDVGSNSSLIYEMVQSEKKLASESDYMASEKNLAKESDYSASAGPLLGSCTSAPSGSAIVSSIGAFRAGMGDDIVQSPLGGEECSMGSSCVVEEELAGLEREILGTDTGFESFHEEPVVSSKKMGLDDSHDALLGEGGEYQSSCEAWWKRRAAHWFVEARQANTFWSLALAAAVMGLVILGQRWQHERCQNSHLRLQLYAKDEKISQLIFQVVRLKDALSGRRRVPVLRSSSSYNSFRDRF